MQKLEAYCYENFRNAVHPALRGRVRETFLIKDILNRAKRMNRMLHLSVLAKTIHPSFFDTLQVAVDLSPEQFVTWYRDLMLMNAERTQKPNTVGRVLPSIDHIFSEVTGSDWRLTAEENDAKLSGKLAGIVKYTEIKKNIFHLRMDSFVHPGVWFEVQYDAKHGKFCSSFDDATGDYRLCGRMAASAASDLRIRALGMSRFRVNDLLHLEVWAEGDLPLPHRQSKKRQRLTK